MKTQCNTKDLHGSLVHGLAIELCSFARSIAQNEHDAEDYAQEAWLALLRSRVNLGTDVGPWLRTVVRRRRVDGLRRAQPLEYRDDVEPHSAGPQQSSNHGAKEWLAPVVQRALDRLPRHHRHVLERRFLRGESLKSVAKELGVPEETVRSRQRRALKRLRSQLSARW